MSGHLRYDRRHLLERHIRAVVVDVQVIEQARVRPAGAQLRQTFLQRVDALCHALRGILFNVINHCDSPPAVTNVPTS